MLYHLGYVVHHLATGNLRVIRCRAHHQQCPAQNTHQQGYRSLVDLRYALQGYTQIAHTENRNNQNR